MADKPGNNDSLYESFKESNWISSTPKPENYRHETKFNSEFDETLDSEYKSALSDVTFENNKKSLSTIATEGSTNASDSELGSPTSLAEDETEKQQDDNGNSFDFDEGEEALSKEISWNIEKNQSIGEIGVCKKSLSTIGIKGSANTSYSELSLPTSLTDDEAENTDQEEHGDSSTNIYFDEDEVALRENISQNIEKNQSSSENDVYKTSCGRDKRLLEVIPDFQYCKCEESSFTEQNSENSNVCEKNQSFGESDVSKTSLGIEKMVSDDETDFQSFKFEKKSLPGQTKERSNVSEFASHKLTNKQTTETFNEECALKKDGSSEKSCNKIFMSSPIDLGRFQRSPLPLNTSSSKRQRTVQENSSPKSDTFCAKRRKLDEGNQTRENYVSDSATKSAPPSPISHSSTARGFYINSQKKERKSLSYFYSKFKKNISNSSKFRVTNRIIWEKAQGISKPESLQEITSESFKQSESKKVDNDLLIHSSKNLVYDDNELTCHPFPTCVEKEEGQDTFESQTSKTDLSCFFPHFSFSTSVAGVQDDLTTEGEERDQRENSVTMTENDVLASKDSSFGLKKDITSDLCSVINERKLDSTDSDRNTKSNSPSTSKDLTYTDGTDYFDPQVSTANSGTNQGFDKNDVCNKTTWGKDEILSEIIPDFQYWKSDENTLTEQTSKNSDVCGKNQCFDKNDVYNASLAREKMLSDEKQDFKNFQFKENSLPEQKNESSNVCSYISHRLGEKECAETLHKECTLKEDEKSEKSSNEIFTSNPFDLERFQRSPMPLNMSLKLQGEALTDHTSPTSGQLNVSNRTLCENTETTFQPASLQKIAAENWKQFIINKRDDDTPMDTDENLISDGKLTPHSFITYVNREENQDTLESQTSKTDLSSIFPHCATSSEYVAEVQDGSEIERNEVPKERGVTVRENDVLAGKDSSGGLKKNTTYHSCSAIDETKMDSRDSDQDIMSNSFSTSRELSYPEGICSFDHEASTENSRTNPSTSSLICCPFCKNIFSEASPSKSNLMEVTTNEDENDKTTKEHHPSFDAILALFDIDNALSKNILLAILGRDFTTGASYTEIIKYLRKERVFSTKLTETIKCFLRTAVNANILRMKRRRYFLVPRDDAVESQLIQIDAGERSRNSNNELLNGQDFSSGTKSKLGNENNLKNISLDLAARKKISTRKTRQTSQEMNS